MQPGTGFQILVGWGLGSRHLYRLIPEKRTYPNTSEVWQTSEVCSSLDFYFPPF
jgi:hypothetical protein